MHQLHVIAKSEVESATWQAVNQNREVIVIRLYTIIIVMSYEGTIVVDSVQSILCVHVSWWEGGTIILRLLCNC